MKKILNFQGVADRIGVTRKTLYNMMKDGRFRVKPIPKSKPRRWVAAKIDSWWMRGKA